MRSWLLCMHRLLAGTPFDSIMPDLLGAVNDGKVLGIVVCHDQRWAAHPLDLHAAV